MTDNNVPKITNKNIPKDAYFVIKMCLGCDDMNELATPMEVPFPSLNMAKAVVTAAMEDLVNDGGKVVDNVAHIVDTDGNSHRYIQAIIKISNEIVWRPGDDEQLNTAFNDIVKDINFNPDVNE